MLEFPSAGRSAFGLLVVLFAFGARAAEPPAPLPPLPPLPAFPGAEGFGTQTPGGRGGSVYEVTNLNDSGPGSLRDAVSQGNRTVVFRVSGTIELQKKLVINKPFITIAGQTAPGDGICTRNFTVSTATHDVVVRYMRFRLGDTSGQEDDSFTVGNGSSNIVLDHCSATWSVDECLSLAGDNSNITLQWCLIAEGLNHSIHTKGDHGYGSLARANGPVSFHDNLWAHNNSRNPRLGDNYGRGTAPFFDVRNNVIYDYGSIASGLTQGKFNANYVANYIRPGPSSKAKAPIHIGDPSELVFYVHDNIFEGNDKLTADNTQFFDPVSINGTVQVKTAADPFPVSSPVRTLGAKEAYEAVLEGVGATLPARYSVDTRIIGEVRDRKGSIIDTQKQVGGWPELKSAQAPADTDHDGIPDAWEAAHGLDPKDAADGAAKTKEGYTNLEVYLNGIKGR